MRPLWRVVITALSFVLLAVTCVSGQQSVVSNHAMIQPPAAALYPSGEEASGDARADAGNAAPAVAPAREWFGSAKPWTRWKHVTGDWSGLRSALDNRGVTIGVAGTSDLSAVTRPQTAAGALRTLFDTGVALDLQKIAGIRGGTAFVQYRLLTGRNGSDIAGGVQAFSNIDSGRFRGLGEVWYEQLLIGKTLRAKIGRVDANKEFANVLTAGDFLNSSMGFSPTIVGFPTYPTVAPSLSLFVTVGGRVEIGAGVFDLGRVPDNTSGNSERQRFEVGQVAVTWDGGDSGLEGRVGIGVWRRRATIATLDGVATVAMQHGPYAVLEQMVWRERGGDGEDVRRISLFVMYGHADAAVSDVVSHVGAGLVWTGVVPQRRGDVLGFGYSSVRLSPWSSLALAGGSEIAVGPFYKVRLNEWTSIQPDVQVIRQHSLLLAPKATIAATCRMIFDF